MAMPDPEIEFSDVTRRPRERRLRPDRNRHYAAVPCQEPGDEDLPVFVDVDALRDIEAHAASDTRVELGGVLLGGQYEDEDGRPFVVVHDGLRAEHYRSTKGSFKFTHDTWSQITRQRDAFPDDMAMIGWYHTHPNWGVFLSTMDMFICDHFFSGPLDVALVVDPCRRERGWFQRSDGDGQRMRRLGGFYVIGSRHRRAELEMAAAHWEGKFTMANDPRLGGLPAPGGVYPVPVAAGDARPSWHAVALMGMLAVQFVFLAVIAWRILFPTEPGTTDRSEQVAAVVERLDRLVQAQRNDQAVDAKLDVLDRVVGQLGDGSTEGVVRLLEEARRENASLKTDARVYRAREVQVTRENETLREKLNASQGAIDDLRDRVAELQREIVAYEEKEGQYRRRVAALENQRQSGESSKPAAEQATPDDQTRAVWLWGCVGLAAVVLVGLGVIAALSKRSIDDDASSEAVPDDEGGTDDDR